LHLQKKQAGGLLAPCFFGVTPAGHLRYSHWLRKCCGLAIEFEATRGESQSLSFMKLKQHFEAEKMEKTQPDTYWGCCENDTGFLWICLKDQPDY